MSNGNSLLTISMIAKESLMEFKNQLGFTKGANRQYDKQFAVEGAKIGSVINVRKPLRYAVTDGPTLVVQDTQEDSIALTLDTQRHVGLQFSSKDLKLSVDEFRKRYIGPAVTALANDCDSTGLSTCYKQVPNFVGVPGVTPATALLYLQAGQKLDEFAAPMDGKRSMLVNPGAQATIVDALKGLFQSSSDIAKQYKRGQMGEGLGFDWSMSQNIPAHKVGPLGGTPLADGGGTVTGASISTKGWTSAAASRLKKGDVITFANVNAVNPQSKVSTGSLQQFVVTADFSSDGSGNGAVSIYPSIVTSGATQTVDAAPVDGAAILIFGAANTYHDAVTPVNLAYHEDAFIFGCADLPQPGGVDMAAVARDPESGLSLRIVRNYDIVNDRFPCRLDILFGWKAFRPEWACRVQG